MPQRSLNAVLDVAQAFASATVTTATDGNIIDTRGYDSIMFAVTIDDLETGETISVSLEEGDESNLSDESQVVAPDVVVDAYKNGTASNNESDGGATLSLSYAAGDRDGTYKISYVGTKRYVRIADVTVTGGDGATVSAVAIKGHKHQVASGAS